MKILIVGCGDIGTKVGYELLKQENVVHALKRTPPPNTNSIFYIKADITDQNQIKKLDTDYDIVLFIPTVDSRTKEAYVKLYDVGLNNVLTHFAKQKSKTVFIFISSSVVYSQNKGEEVSEDTRLQKGVNFRADILIEAEKQVIQHNEKSIILRFSGIYGRGEQQMIKKLKKNIPIQETPPYYTNRIHVDDCVNSILFMIEKSAKEKLPKNTYNVTETKVLPLYEYACMVAKENSLSIPVKKILDEKATSQGKKISNKHLLSLGYQFLTT